MTLLVVSISAVPKNKDNPSSPNEFKGFKLKPANAFTMNENGDKFKLDYDIYSITFDMKVKKWNGRLKTPSDYGRESQVFYEKVNFKEDHIKKDRLKDSNPKAYKYLKNNKKELIKDSVASYSTEWGWYFHGSNKKDVQYLELHISGINPDLYSVDHSLIRDFNNTVIHDNYYINFPSGVKMSFLEGCDIEMVDKTFFKIHGDPSVCGDPITQTSTDIIIEGFPAGGTPTSVGSKTLTDNTQTWDTNEHANRLIAIKNGTGAGQRRYIVSNNIDTITLDYDWVVKPDTSSVFRVGYTWEDVYNASVTGGWGMVSKQGRDQYYLDGALKIGLQGNETWFMDSGFQLEHNLTYINIGWNGFKAIDLGANAYYVEGEVINFDKRYTARPSSHHIERDKNFYIFPPNNGTVELYGTSANSNSFDSAGFGDISVDKLWNALGSSGITYSAKPDSDLFNVNIMLGGGDSGGAMFGFIGAPIFAESLRFAGSNLIWNSATEVINNVTIDNFQADLKLNRLFNMAGFVDAGSRVTLLDSISNADKVMTVDSQGFTGIMHRSWRFNVEIVEFNGTPISGVNVSLYNSTGSPAFKSDNNSYHIIPNPISTGDNGKIAQKRVDEGYWIDTNIGVNHVEDVKTQNPFTLVINKSGYFPINYTFNITDTIDLKIPLYKKWELPNLKYINISNTDNKLRFVACS